MDDVYGSIIEYVIANTAYESSVVMNDVVSKIRQADSMEIIFKIPITERIFSCNTALQWSYFICFTVNYITKESVTVPSTFINSFSIENAVMFISNTYDLYNKAIHQEYFYDSE